LERREQGQGKISELATVNRRGELLLKFYLREERLRRKVKPLFLKAEGYDIEDPKEAHEHASSET